MSDLWDDLNDIQKSYLQAIYQADQENERSHHKNYSSEKASTWRWLPYNREASRVSYTLVNPLAMKLRSFNHSLKEARMIFTQLADLGLIEQRNQTDKECSRPYLAIQITREGRALIRQMLGPSIRLTEHQRAFARIVADLGLATLDDAARAFLRKDDAQIEAWRPAVQAAKSKAKNETYPMVIKTVACAWCGAEIQVSALRHALYSHNPVRHVHLHYDHQDFWFEQYGCSQECEHKIRGAKVTISLERDTDANPL